MPAASVPNPELFTASALRVLERACGIAAKSQHLLVGPAHVLQALLDDESHAATILEEHGFDRRYADELVSGLPTADLAPSYVVDPIAPPEDPDTRLVVLHATRFANAARRGRLVGSEHLLFGLVAVPSAVAELLQQIELDEAAIARLNVGDETTRGEPLPVDFVIEFEGTRDVESEAEADEPDLDEVPAASLIEVGNATSHAVASRRTVGESPVVGDRRPPEIPQEPDQDSMPDAEFDDFDGEDESETPTAADEFHDPSTLVDDIEMNLDELGASESEADETETIVREPVEPRLDVGVDVYRILDAAANRVREGLRVTEDYLRFVLDDAHLVGLLKSLRHDVAATTSSFEEVARLRSRDTEGDVGTTITTHAESHRGTTADVLRAALKRSEEALRSLEEFGKLARPGVGAEFESYRYRLYTLEKAVIGTVHSREILAGRALYLLLTRDLCDGDPERVLTQSIAGGVSIVQIREKNMPDREFLEWAGRVRAVTRAADVLLIVNDRPDLAVLCDADGVHVGQDDASVRQARRIVGPRRMVGVSTHDLAQARRAVLDGADYIGVGPTFPSRTKAFDEFAGLDFVRAVSSEIRLPTYVLGGVNTSNVADVVQAGGRRVAVTGALSSPADATDPADAAGALLAELRRVAE